jgi:2-methylisocitrate lyase-like PEP mutase family enzyme
LLRNLLKEGTIVIPGGFSPLVVMIAERLGYKAMYMSGYGTSAF